MRRRYRAGSLEGPRSPRRPSASGSPPRSPGCPSGACRRRSGPRSWGSCCPRHSLFDRERRRRGRARDVPPRACEATSRVQPEAPRSSRTRKCGTERAAHPAIPKYATGMPGRSRIAGNRKAADQRQNQHLHGYRPAPSGACHGRSARRRPIVLERPDRAQALRACGFRMQSCESRAGRARRQRRRPARRSADRAGSVPCTRSRRDALQRGRARPLQNT